MEKLPKNWVRIPLKEIVKSIKGKKPTQLSENEFDNSLPYMDIKALEYNIIRQYADISSSKSFEKGDVAMVWDGARSGWVSKANYGAIGSTIVAIKTIKFNSDYLYYYLLDKYPYINSNARGVGIPHVDPTILWELEFPLPPLPEQQRIVAKLDTLFGQLEAIKKSLENVPMLIKNFRQQVLKQAITGKLTEEWRKVNELEGWKECLLDNISERITVGYVGKMIDKYVDKGIPFLRSQNVREFKFDEKNLLYINSEFNEEIKKSKLKPLDVVVVRSGYPGTTCVIPENISVANCSDILILTPNRKVLNSYYVAIFMNSNFGKKVVFHGKVGNAQQHFNTKTLKETLLPLPPLEEQQEIVRRVESLFAKADAIEEQYMSLKDKINKLPQSILHKAFKGELTEQLDSDGDAADLLKEIEKLKSQTTKAGKKLVKKYPVSKAVLGMVTEGENKYS